MKMEKEVIESEKKASELKHIPLELLDDFPNHPFKVRDDEDMLELIESVTERGVLVPAMVRPRRMVDMNSYQDIEENGQVSVWVKIHCSALLKIWMMRKLLS